MAIEDIKKGVKEINERKSELEQKVSEALLEFEKFKSLQVESLSFIRRSCCTELGTEIEFKYVTEACVLIK